MDKINEYPIAGKSGEYIISVPKNSTILSVRRSINASDIVIGVLVDLDNYGELVEKTILVFDTYSEIEDNLKARFIGAVTTGEYKMALVTGEEVYYVFEKLR